MSDAKKFGLHFPIGNDQTLQVLKGHLLLEESIREFLIVLTSHPAALKGDSGTSFDCHQAICIVQAFYPFSDQIDWVWESAKRLNRLRNKLAHNLEPNGVSDSIAAFNKYVYECAPSQIEEAKNSELGTLKNADFMFSVMAVCSQLAVHKEEFKQISHNKCINTICYTRRC
ncbi:hypothetical protein [Aliivibrio fischeri]|nr:hypothetical protein [Aliivibrio fischeri]USR97101.1 hypothetical protein AVFI_18115 [Aliivibrio fischeri ATCC 7744 = JCM 18803 = DSM 507]USR97144.1 hypothetical protein AVFI_18345 [Aliivibrio fischeri ATCC 7744 = JCM 18803 = DSM 507]